MGALGGKKIEGRGRGGTAGGMLQPSATLCPAIGCCPLNAQIHCIGAVVFVMQQRQNATTTPRTSYLIGQKVQRCKPYHDRPKGSLRDSLEVG